MTRILILERILLRNGEHMIQGTKRYTHLFEITYTTIWYLCENVAEKALTKITDTDDRYNDVKKRNQNTQS